MSTDMIYAPPSTHPVTAAINAVVPFGGKWTVVPTELYDAISRYAISRESMNEILGIGTGSGFDRRTRIMTMGQRIRAARLDIANLNITMARGTANGQSVYRFSRPVA